MHMQNIAMRHTHFVVAIWRHVRAYVYVDALCMNAVVLIGKVYTHTHPLIIFICTFVVVLKNYS